jgi:Bacteriophage tail sheath protein
MATNVTYPGVYMQEVPSGVRPIEMASTSTAAFLGSRRTWAHRRGSQELQLHAVPNPLRRISARPLSRPRGVPVLQQRGAQCYVGRVAARAATANVTILDRGTAAQPSMTISASSPGVWGNQLQVVVDSEVGDPGNLFNIAVLRFDPDADDQPAPLESFSDLSMDPASPAYIERVVNVGSTYIRVAVNRSNTNQIAGFSESGAITLTGDLLGANQRKFRLSMHGEGFPRGRPDRQARGRRDHRTRRHSGGHAGRHPGAAPLRDSTPAAAYGAATVTVQDSNRLRARLGRGRGRLERRDPRR